MSEHLSVIAVFYKKQTLSTLHRHNIQKESFHHELLIIFKLLNWVQTDLFPGIKKPINIRWRKENCSTLPSPFFVANWRVVKTWNCGEIAGRSVAICDDSAYARSGSRTDARTLTAVLLLHKPKKSHCSLTTAYHVKMRLFWWMITKKYTDQCALINTAI